MKKNVLILSVSLIFALVLTGCSSTTTTAVDSSIVENIETVEAEIPEVTEEPVIKAATSFEISMDDFTFSETELVVPVGKEITINLTNVEGTHDLIIDEFDLHSEHLAVGESEVLSFTIPEEHLGKRYEFYCSVGEHRAMGMVGTITVVE